MTQHTRSYGVALGPDHYIHGGTDGATRIHCNWLPWADHQTRWPHLPQYAGMELLGVTEFECQNDVQGLLQFKVAVYRHQRFHRALEEAGVEMNRNGSHPACEFVLLPPFGEDGRFLFGDPTGQTYDVQIVRPYLISRTTVVQAVYAHVMGNNPAHNQSGPLYPVEEVSWNDAVEFCVQVGLRLPSETEWEYACRAGSTTAFTFGDEPGRLGEFGWYADNSDSHTHPVGELAHNAFGLFDMHGNVWEWCQDEWNDLTADVRTDGSAWGGPEADPYAPWQPAPVSEDEQRSLEPASQGASPVDHRSETGAARGGSTSVSAVSARPEGEQSSDPTAASEVTRATSAWPREQLEGSGSAQPGDQNADPTSAPALSAATGDGSGAHGATPRSATSSPGISEPPSETVPASGSEQSGAERPDPLAGFSGVAERPTTTRGPQPTPSFAGARPPETAGGVSRPSSGASPAASASALGGEQSADPPIRTFCSSGPISQPPTPTRQTPAPTAAGAPSMGGTASPSPSPSNSSTRSSGATITGPALDFPRSGSGFEQAEPRPDPTRASAGSWSGPASSTPRAGIGDAAQANGQTTESDSEAQEDEHSSDPSETTDVSTGAAIGTDPQSTAEAVMVPPSPTAGLGSDSGAREGEQSADPFLATAVDQCTVPSTSAAVRSGVAPVNGLASTASGAAGGAANPCREMVLLPHQEEALRRALQREVFVEGEIAALALMGRNEVPHFSFPIILGAHVTRGSACRHSGAGIEWVSVARVADRSWRPILGFRPVASTATREEPGSPAA